MNLNQLELKLTFLTFEVLVFNKKNQQNQIMIFNNDSQTNTHMFV